jgi:hypothetical protein
MSKPKREDFRTTLKDSLDEAAWSWLKPHSERQALILVAQELDLIDVGEKVALDEATTVQEWIASGQLTRPLPHQAEAWEATPDKRFVTLIVSPYVLIQEKAH